MRVGRKAGSDLKIQIEGGLTLEGVARISGSKNAALPIMAATLLAAEGSSVLMDVPNIDDVSTLLLVLKNLGAHATLRNNELTVTASTLSSVQPPYDLVGQMRASFLVAGPLLARYGEVKIPLPGGCAIGSRPIDLHLKGFTALGATVDQGPGYVSIRACHLVGTSIYLDFPSVGATENLLMAATLAQGTTVIENAAEEPEIVDLANFLTAMGAEVRGAGTRRIRIQGVPSLHGAKHTVIPDRIEAGTFLMAAAATRGDVILQNVLGAHLAAVIAKLREVGCEIEESGRDIHLVMRSRPKPIDLVTLPHPGFPTDLQAPMMSLLTFAQGASVISETVFENRFMHVPELLRMGANIRIEGRTAIVHGQSVLYGAAARMTDLRAGAALVVAALGARGQSILYDPHHLDRGYENFEERLKQLGANIKRVD